MSIPRLVRIHKNTKCFPKGFHYCQFHRCLPAVKFLLFARYYFVSAIVSTRIYYSSPPVAPKKIPIRNFRFKYSKLHSARNFSFRYSKIIIYQKLLLQILQNYDLPETSASVRQILMFTLLLYYFISKIYLTY